MNDSKYFQMPAIPHSGTFVVVQGGRHAGKLHHLDMVIAKREQELNDLKQLRRELLKGMKK